MSQYYGVFFTNGIVIGCIYALIALGFNVIFSTTGIINFAQGEFVMIGGIAAAVAKTAWGWSLVASVGFGVGVAALVGLLSYLIFIYPARGASTVTYIIITIAISLILKSSASFIWGTEPYTLPQFTSGSVAIGGGSVANHSLLVIPLAGVTMLALLIFYKYTKLGLDMRASADNPDAARLCGISVPKVSAWSFLISASLAGVAGALITPILSMQFDAGTMTGLKGFAAAILGGMGNPIGCVAGGLALGLIEQSIRLVSSEFTDIIALVVVVVFLILRPKGLLAKS